MKDFIDGLKKHGRRVEESEDDEGNFCWIWWNVKNDYVEIHDNPHEQPILMVACLDEIERLGWQPLMGREQNGKKYFATAWGRYIASGQREVTQRALCKTRTGACCNALMAVLEARGDEGGAQSPTP